MNTDRLIMVDPLDVHARLRKLGLRASDLTDAMLAGASAMTTCMENHPPIYSGLKFWAETVRALRDRKLEDGWNRDDSGNYSTVVNAGRTIQIAVARGDEWTGRAEAPSGRPSTRHPKGVATQRVVEANQLSLFDPVPVPDNDQAGAPLITWVLLHYRDQHALRCELSTPTAITPHGFVEEWNERIIIDEIHFGNINIPMDESPVEPDVLVRRRE